MKPIALENTNKLLEEIANYLSTGEDLDLFTEKRFFREAEQQATLERKHILVAYTHTLIGDRNNAKHHALEALKYLEDGATISSCLSILQMNAYPKLTIESVRDLQNYLDNPSYICSFTSFFASYPDILLMERLMTQLEKMNLSTDKRFEQLFRFLSEQSRQIDSLTSEFGLDKTMCTKLIDLAAAILESSQVPLHSTSIERQRESDWFDILIHVETDNTEQLTELNWKLIDQLVDAELNNTSIVIRFEMVDPSKRIARLRYAS